MPKNVVAGTCVRPSRSTALRRCVTIRRALGSPAPASRALAGAHAGSVRVRGGYYVPVRTVTVIHIGGSGPRTHVAGGGRIFTCALASDS